MNKKHMFQVPSLPSNLGEPMTSILAYQADEYGCPDLTPEQIKKLITETGDLNQFDLITLETQRRYYNASHVERTHKGFKRWIERCLLHIPSNTARLEIAELLCIDKPDLTAAVLVMLNDQDPNLVTKLLEGRISAAARAIPSENYGDALDEHDVREIIVAVSRLWIAHDLQLEAAAAHVRIFRPTECSPLDGAHNGKAPRNSAIAVRISNELKLFEEAARLYFGEKDKPLPRACLASFTRSNATVDTRLGHYAITWPSVTFRHFGRDATNAEAAVFRDADNLEQRAQIMLSIWRAAHGDDLEDYIRQRMIQGRALLRRLRSDTDRIRADETLSDQPTYKGRGLDPLIRLWLACERAVAWTGPIDTGEKAIDRAIPQVLDSAICAVQSGQQVGLPAIKKHNVKLANRLFFVLRCIITRDPYHLPKGLRKVTNAAGETITAGTRQDAEAHRGKEFTFHEIQRHQRLRNGKGNKRNSKGVYDHGFTTDSNDFTREHLRNPTFESTQIVEQAWGTISWRLNQK